MREDIVSSSARPVVPERVAVSGARSVLLAVLFGAALAPMHVAADSASAIAGSSATDDAATHSSSGAPALPGFRAKQPAPGFVLPPLGQEPFGPQPATVVEVRAFRFEGNTVFTDAELQRVAAPYAGRALTASDLEQLRHELTRLYIDRGHLNSGAVIPPDQVHEGQLLIRLVEGRLEAVRVTGMQRLHDDYVRDRLSHGEGPLDVKALQRDLQLLLLDPLFTKMDARLLPGSEPGLAILDVDVTRSRPYQLSVFGNNYRPPSIGEYSLSFSGWVRNLTGRGDQLDAGIQNNANSTGSPHYSVAWNVPLDTRGTSAQLRAEHGRSSVIEEPVQSVDIRSFLDSREYGLTHTVYETLERKFSLGLAFVRRRNSTTLLGEPFSFVPGEPTGSVQILVWRFAQDYVQRFERDVLALRSTFSSGRNNVAQSADPAVASVQPAPSFLAWLGQVQYARRIADSGAELLVRGDVQIAHDRLLPLERIAIGGVNTVRGYRENQMVRDHGLRLSIDYQIPVLGRQEQRSSLTIGPFADYGLAKNVAESAAHLSSAGIGLHWRWQRVSADLYVARRFVKVTRPAESALQDKGIHLEIRFDAF